MEHLLRQPQNIRNYSSNIFNKYYFKTRKTHKHRRGENGNDISFPSYYFHHQLLLNLNLNEHFTLDLQRFNVNENNFISSY